MTTRLAYSTSTLTVAQQHHRDVAVLLAAARKARKDPCHKCAKKEAHTH